jgi:hypothetical protein
MDLWKILVMGTIRLTVIGTMTNSRILSTIIKRRQMLGHEIIDDKIYPLQTLKDNISLLTPDILDKNHLLYPHSG